MAYDAHILNPSIPDIIPAILPAMRIAILGTRGIPNRHGGFEQFAEHCGVKLAERGHHVSVYCSHDHPYQGREWNGVTLLHCKDPEHRWGTAGQFIYDLNCIMDCRKRNFDVILQLGYTSSTIWSWLFPEKPLLVTNMDGLEWKRSKYNKGVQYFLRHAERWGALYSDHLIADSLAIKDYLSKRYGKDSCFISYGAAVYEPQPGDETILQTRGYASGKYDLLIARFEPENNIETILRAYARQTEQPLVLIGNHEATAFGRKVHALFSNYQHIHFEGPLYDLEQLNVLRYHSRLYLHGHSVGGTNPSLLEAMSCQALIAAHDNEFNRSVLGPNALWFSDSDSLSRIIHTIEDKRHYNKWILNNKNEILKTYNWDTITQTLETQLFAWLQQKQ